MGSVWKGRACWATTRVASRVAGRGFSGRRILLVRDVVRLEDWVGGDGLTSPCFGVLQYALLGLFFGALSWHWHFGWVGECRALGW
jgi:hypothetical protein